ncbi:MAG: ABC transporter ATP-binding protein [Promethearchaeota archaeon]|nr:MAG: ABC transporter ATP-binding protein [Candidatus Lokiarchaeota archaeon]
MDNSKKNPQISKKNRTSINQTVEFSPEIDRFIKARQQGTRQWILAHLFHKSNKYFIFIVLMTTILSANLSSASLVVLGMTISELMEGNDSNLIFYVIIILILGVSAPILRLFNFLVRETLAQRLERDVRKEFFTNLLGKSQSFHDKQKIGEVMARATDDVRMLNFMVSPALSLIIESFTSLIIPLIYIALFFPPQLLLAPLIFIILFLFALRSYIRKITPVTGILRFSFGRMNATLTETLNGIEVVKSSTQELAEMKKYVDKAMNYRNAYIKQGHIQAKYLPLLFFALSVTLGLTHAIYLYYQGVLNIGQIIAYVGLVSLLRFPTFISIFVFAIIRLAVTGAQRLLDFMNQETEIDENLEGIEKIIEGNIKFENVSFSYSKRSKPILKNLSFEVKAGQTIAIVGTTGSGKTTLTKLISRLYDVDEGKILVDNLDIRNYALESLRSQISYIEQDVFLFSTSVFENITFGRTSSMDDVEMVAKEAQAHGFISKLPNGYYSEVGERGVQLSGGERQRIAIARAFLSDPRILILDDSTSAIDSATEDKIQKAIRNILKNRTTILITHRLSQIRWADLIIVLKRGEIVAKGTHEELLKTSEEYRKIFVKKFDVDLDYLLKKCEEEL